MNRTMTLLALLCLCAAEGRAQSAPNATTDDRLDQLEQQYREQAAKQQYLPQLHGMLRGKYEYEPDLEASRFEVRNARLAVEGRMPLRSSYKLEVDLCDESQIKMKDAWVRLNPWRTLRATVGQQRMPFSIDAHRNPAAQYFANRSFIAKQVGDVRDVGFQLGYDFVASDGRKVLVIDAGIFNGSNLASEETAWFAFGKSSDGPPHVAPGYSAKVQYFPIKGLALVPSIQHQQIAGRQATYTSVDFGAYYEVRGFHLEAEYLRKQYANDAFDVCHATDVMAIYRMAVKPRYVEGLSYLLRYDYMGDHSDGKKGFAEGSTRLQLSDAERHRLTAGLTLHVANRYFPTDLRLNYEKYWYPHGGVAKVSEQDKIVAELSIRF